MALMGILMVLRDNSLSTSGTSLVHLLHSFGEDSSQGGDC